MPNVVTDSVDQAHEFSAPERALLSRYCTNVDRSVFALRNLPEVVKGALFSRYSRTEKSLRRVLLDEFLKEPAAGISADAAHPDERVDVARGEDFYQRVLVGYGDDSVAELAGAHIAVEQVSNLGAKALEDSRIGIAPLEKSTRYVRFDRRDPGGRFPYYRGPELAHPAYEPAMDALFACYSGMIVPLTDRIREEHPLEEGESDRAWKSATRAKALDLLRGLLPAATLTNLGLYGNGRAFEYLLTKLAASDLQEATGLAREMHAELTQVIPAFVRRALDDRYGVPAAAFMATARRRTADLAPPAKGAASSSGPEVRLVEYDADAEQRVVAAALFPHSDLPLKELAGSDVDVDAVMAAVMGERQNRRHRAPRAFEHTAYTFEITANFGAYRDLQRHRMLTQQRQVLGTSLGYDVPVELARYGVDGKFSQAIETAAEAHRALTGGIGPNLAQYAVPLAFRIRWYFRATLREVYHLCELRTGPEGHPDYRYVAQEMFRRVREVHPRLVKQARFVDLGPGDQLERRASERRIDRKMAELR
jgi:thymidylate synthase ThyX